MYTNNYISFSYLFQINIKKIENTVTEVQNKIRLAAQICNMDDVSKWQNNFVTNRELNLVFILKFIISIKKKLV